MAGNFEEFYAVGLSELKKNSFDGVLCFGGVDWWYHNRAHSDVQIMTYLSKRIPILFINSIGMRTPRPGLTTQPLKRIFRKLGSVLKGLRKVGPNMWVFSPLMLPPGSNLWMRKINAILIAAQVRLVLKIVGIRKWFVWVTIPTAVDVIEKLPKSMIVFNRSDAFSKFPEACSEYIKNCEDKLLENSDMVLYVNRKLMAEDKGPGERKHYVGHGVDYGHFAGATCAGTIVHSELAGISRPIVGFFGAIDDYTVDLKLLKYAAQSLPEMSFVLIGLSTVDISDITSLPNVHYLGFRPYLEIPKFGAGFDVGIMPWLQNEWIDYCNPVKLKEYLALGIPVVTTPIPQAEEYPHLLAVTRTRQEFVEAIRNSVKLNDEQSKILRQKAVQNDSWQNKAEVILRLVEGIANQRPV